MCTSVQDPVRCRSARHSHCNHHVPRVPRWDIHPLPLDHVGSCRPVFSSWIQIATSLLSGDLIVCRVPNMHDLMGKLTMSGLRRQCNNMICSIVAAERLQIYCIAVQLSSQFSISTLKAVKTAVAFHTVNIYEWGGWCCRVSTYLLCLPVWMESFNEDSVSCSRYEGKH